MKFLIDECTGPAVVKWLRGLNYDVFSVYDEARGLDDERPENKIKVLNHVLESYFDKLANNFVIVTEKTVRIIEERNK